MQQHTSDNIKHSSISILQVPTNTMSMSNETLHTSSVAGSSNQKTKSNPHDCSWRMKYFYNNKEGEFLA